MSSSKNVSRGTGGANKKEKPAQFIPREKTVPAKVVVGEQPIIDFRPPAAHLKGAFLVMATNGTRTRSWLAHHPIGVTRLDAADWVWSTMSDVPTLLSQRSDPDADELVANRAEARLAIAVRDGLLGQSPDGTRLYPKGKVSRAASLAAAKKAANEDHALREAEWRHEGEKGERPKKADPLAFLPPDLRPEEEDLRAHSKLERVQAEVLVQWPDTFETRFGANFEFCQESACVPGGKPPADDTAFDGLVYQLNQTQIMGLAQAKAERPVVQPAAPKGPLTATPTPSKKLDGGGGSSTSKKKGKDRA